MFVCLYAEAYNKQYKVHLASHHCKINLRRDLDHAVRVNFATTISWLIFLSLVYLISVPNKPQACSTFPVKPCHCWFMFPEVNSSLFSLSIMHLIKLFFFVYCPQRRSWGSSERRQMSRLWSRSWRKRNQKESILSRKWMKFLDPGMRGDALPR